MQSITMDADARHSKRRQAVIRIAAALGLVSLALRDAWAAGAAPATKLVNVADTRNMPPGIGRWIAGLYNTDYWMYGLVVVVTMVVMGLVLGLGFDRLLAMIGIDLGRLEHAE